MTRYVDISGWIDNGMWQSASNYPGATITEVPQPPEMKDEPPVFNQQFLLSGQSGTYIETKAHADPAATPVSACAIEDFVMNCVVLRVASKRQNEPIEMGELEKLHVDVPPDSAVLLATGWDRHWHTPEQFIAGSPYITADAAQWIFDKKPRLLGADIPRFDYPPQRVFPWQAFWDRVRYLMAPVTNIHQDSFTHGRLFCFPLKIRGAMGTPVRAVLEISPFIMEGR